MTSLKALSCWMIIGIATATLAAATATAHEEAPTDVALAYFNQKDGQLVLSTLAPSSRNPTSWVTKGVFSPRNGLELVIPVANADPDLIINETRGAIGWISTSMSMRFTGTTSLLYSPYGRLEWKVVEGDRASLMTIQCKYNDPYYCDYYKQRKVFAAAFPGHEGAGKPHTHGDGTDAARPLYADDFEWILRYTVAPCSTTNCPILGGSVEYTFSFLIDGSTFVELGTLGRRDAPPPEPEAPAEGNATVPADNETADPDGGNSTGGGSGGNGTASGNRSTTGSGGAASAFRPSAYRAQPDGDAPGASAVALFGGLLGVGLWFRRRQRRAA